MVSGPDAPDIGLSAGSLQGVAVVQSRVQVGLHAVPIGIEVHLSNGLPAFHLIGLPEKGVRESKERVRSAILNAGFRFPERRITINLAPANLPKPDSHLDLAMAIGILLASEQISADVSGYEFYGELALSGELRPIRCILAAAVGCQQAKCTMVTSGHDAVRAVHIEALVVKVATSLLDVCRYLQGDVSLAVASRPAKAPKVALDPSRWPDMRVVRGQAMAKRAMVLAAAGAHNVVLRGPPGTGKTLLAHCLLGILPELSHAEKIDVMLIHALRGQHDLPAHRPFRQPHHSTSSAAMVGGGQPLVPGEVSLAHHGVLLLDEWPEFKPSVLNALREPLETGRMHVSLAGRSATWPADFMLVATCNPCPCGYLGQSRCRCTPNHIQRYQRRISGPLWDRVDMVVDMQASDADELDAEKSLDSVTIKQQVEACRARQHRRAQQHTMSQQEAHMAALRPEAKAVLQQATKQLRVSMRASGRILGVARTIADWADSDPIEAAHVHEALGFRCMPEVS